MPWPQGKIEMHACGCRAFWYYWPIYLAAITFVGFGENKTWAYEVSNQQGHSKKWTYWICIKLIRLRKFAIYKGAVLNAHVSPSWRRASTVGQHQLNLLICVSWIIGLCCLLIKAVCGCRMFHFLLEIGFSKTERLSYSWKKGWQQHNLLKLLR